MMNWLMIEPQGVKVNKSGLPYVIFPTKKMPYRWESVQLNRRFMVLVAIRSTARVNFYCFIF
jgi:hypothetical protein